MSVFLQLDTGGTLKLVMHDVPSVPRSSCASTLLPLSTRFLSCGTSTVNVSVHEHLTVACPSCRRSAWLAAAYEPQPTGNTATATALAPTVQQAPPRVGPSQIGVTRAQGARAGEAVALQQVVLAFGIRQRDVNVRCQDLVMGQPTVARTFYTHLLALGNITDGHDVHPPSGARKDDDGVGLTRVIEQRAQRGRGDAHGRQVARGQRERVDGELWRGLEEAKK